MKRKQLSDLVLGMAEKNVSILRDSKDLLWYASGIMEAKADYHHKERYSAAEVAGLLTAICNYKS